MGVPIKIAIGTKFKVCTHEELIKKGWVHIISSYSHDDFSNLVILSKMIDDYTGKTLTIKKERTKNWYTVEENEWQWPVATFLDTEIIDFTHTCVEGMTPLLGWFIWKHCGRNLKEIK